MSTVEKEDRLTEYMKAVSHIGYTLYLIRGAYECLKDYNASIQNEINEIYRGIRGAARKKDLDPTLGKILRPYRAAALGKIFRTAAITAFIAALLLFFVSYKPGASGILSGHSASSLLRSVLGFIIPSSWGVVDMLPTGNYEADGLIGFILFLLCFFLVFAAVPAVIILVLGFVLYIPFCIIRNLVKRCTTRGSSGTDEMVTCLNAYIAAFNIFNVCLDELYEMELTQVDLLHSLLSLDKLDSAYSGYIPSTQIYTYLNEGRCTGLSGEDGAYALWDSELATGLVTGDLYEAETLSRKNMIPEAQWYLGGEVGQKLKYMGELFTFASSYRDMLEAQLSEERDKAAKRGPIPHFDSKRVSKEAESFMNRSVIADIASVAGHICYETADTLE